MTESNLIWSNARQEASSTVLETLRRFARNASSACKKTWKLLKAFNWRLPATYHVMNGGRSSGRCDQVWPDPILPIYLLICFNCDYKFHRPFTDQFSCVSRSYSISMPALWHSSSSNTVCSWKFRRRSTFAIHEQTGLHDLHIRI